MTMPVPIELALHDPRWAAYAASHPRATIFHTPAWSSVLAGSYGYRAFAVALAKEGRLVGLVPVLEVPGVLQGRRWVSLPFTDISPPLVDQRGDERSLLQALDRARIAADVHTVDLHAAVAIERRP